jgi:hypothetical protein
MRPANKSCGPCQACCVAPKIDTPELRKKAGTPCLHLVQKGCGIYDNRPPVCRSFLCGWRLMPGMDMSWRPDLSGVMLIELPASQIPKPYRTAGPGWIFVVTDGEKAINARLGKFIAGLVARGVAVYLSAMTPRIQVNEQLKPLVAAGDLEGVLNVLRQTHALLHSAGAGTGVGRIWALYRAQLERMRAIAGQRQR